ncbi:hypothetical protein [Arthrobacter sp.]|uniref:hypothetical protein n=1 Tax=Arthrobacter sp. TaxID=1667 RepID=UPI003393A87E
MGQLEPSPTMVVPVCSLVLSAGAAASLGAGDAVGFLSDAAEDIFVIAWLLGWVLLVWAAILGGGYAVLLSLRGPSRRPVSRMEAVLGATSLGITAVVLVTHPLWGTGSALGG